MPTVQYRIVNVFADPHSAGYPFNGNPLAVVENSQGLSTEQMQAITRQLNLSETSFIGPLDGSELSIRIFSPSYELPFAGHPILGTAHIARALLGLGDQFTLKPPAGPVGVSATQDHWTLQTAQPQLSPVEASRAQLASILGLEAEALLDEGLWASLGQRQLLIPLRDPALLGRIQSNADLLARHAANPGGLTAYVFARTAQGFAVRFFWVQNGSLGEDPGTGSACANLGGWWRARHPGVALDARVEQGDFIGRPNRLSLTVSQDGAIRVGGQVVEIGRGSLDW